VRTLISLACVGLLTPTALAAVSARVYRADERTPLAWADPNVPGIYQDIMVGTRLTVFLGSDAALSLWSGGLMIFRDDWAIGTLSGRDCDPNTHRCDGSFFPAAGEDPYLRYTRNALGVNFALDVEGATAGEWLALDYHAEAPGLCNVGVYASETIDELPDGFWPSSLDEPPPAGTVWIQGLSFSHVPSRDYNGDTVVDFVDFALLANEWQGLAVPDPNMEFSADLNADHHVDILDLPLFCAYWLERTDITEPASEPNAPSVAP